MKTMKRERANWYWVYRTKSWSWNYENALDFKWSHVQEEAEEDIALSNFIKNYKSKQMRKISQKVTGWFFKMIGLSYLMKRKIRKIILEVISNTKIIYNLVQWSCQLPRFCQTYRRAGKRWIG